MSDFGIVLILCNKPCQFVQALRYTAAKEALTSNQSVKVCLKYLICIFILRHVSEKNATEDIENA